MSIPIENMKSDRKVTKRIQAERKQSLSLTFKGTVDGFFNQNDEDWWATNVNIKLKFLSLTAAFAE